ncbi:MAG: hypothetical protein GC185_12885 [Alphaproteobacteria bacterium]|nr:hypothetical protein [Alphaproteobacteria bacterium]
MAITDEELERMAKNLKQAFEDVSGHYEYLKRGSGYYNIGESPQYRETAATLAAVSTAWLQVDKEQKARAEERESSVKQPLAKPLKPSRSS